MRRAYRDGVLYGIHLAAGPVTISDRWTAVIDDVQSS